MVDKQYAGPPQNVRVENHVPTCKVGLIQEHRGGWVLDHDFA